MLSLAILNLSYILESVSLYLLNSDLSLFEQDPLMLVSELFFLILQTLLMFAWLWLLCQS